jgi:hypothetical protein
MKDKFDLPYICNKMILRLWFGKIVLFRLDMHQTQTQTQTVWVWV